LKLSIGEYLRSEREKQHLSLDDIANKTLIRKYYLEQIENNDFKRYDGFISAYIRKYAEALGVDPEPLIVQYKALFEEPLEKKKETDKHSFWLVAIIAVLLIGVSAFGIRFAVHNRAVENNPTPEIKQPVETNTNNSQSKETPSENKNEKKSPAQNSTVEKTYNGVDVVVSVNKLCWLGVTVDGKYNQMFLYPGNKKEFKGKKYVKIRFGNATHAYVTVNGKKLGVVSKDKKVVEVTYKP
jgi:cytoskeleton protein RodZ